jgi:hypothetical protein
MPHLFHKRDRENGQLAVCPDRVKTFSQLLKDKIDTDGDGLISKREFIRGYCIWQMHIKKAAMHQVRKTQEKDKREKRKRAKEKARLLYSADAHEEGAIRSLACGHIVGGAGITPRERARERREGVKENPGLKKKSG